MLAKFYTWSVAQAILKLPVWLHAVGVHRETFQVVEVRPLPVVTKNSPIPPQKIHIMRVGSNMNQMGQTSQQRGHGGVCGDQRIVWIALLPQAEIRGLRQHTCQEIAQFVKVKQGFLLPRSHKTLKSLPLPFFLRKEETRHFPTSFRGRRAGMCLDLSNSPQGINIF